MNNLLVGGDVIGGVLRVTDYDSIRIRGSVFNGASEARIELDRVPTFSHFSIGGSLSSPLVVDGVNGALQGHLAVNTLSGNVLLTLPNVYVRNESGQVVTLSPGGAYAQPSCDLGGGVIGTVPFRPYVSTNPSCDSGPTQPYGQTLPPVMLQSEFSQLRSLTANIPGRGIRVVFYGRVAMTGAMNGRPTWPVTLEWLQPQLNQWITVDNSQWRLVAADGAPDTLPVRQVVVFMNPALSLAAMMPAGQYRIRLLDDPITPGARRLYCWDEFANNNVAANSVYVAAFNTDRVLCQFEVRRDCNGDGVEDEVGDCGGTQNGRCVSDVDNDGSFSNGLTPDHAVTVDDLIAFLAAFEAGSVLVDMDDGSGTGQADGGIGIGDLLYFLYWFEVGC